MKKRLPALFLMFVLFLLLCSCQFYICKGEDSFTLKPGTHNLVGLNSERDDYNSAGPPNYSRELNLLYSTKYNKSGANRGYDVYSGTVKFDLERSWSNENDLSSSRGDEVSFLNSNSNERGPIRIPFYYIDKKSVDKDLYLVSTDRLTDSSDFAVDYNILGMYYDNSGDLVCISFGGNTPEYDELYPSYDYKTETLYYCSNKKGTFDIYMCKKDSSRNLLEWLQSSDILTQSVALDVLNSTKNDECPYVFGNYLYFASDRDGGKGGYDIYYSKKDSSGNFTAPVCESMNTASNEYRVSCYRFNSSDIDSKPDFVIYSSDRSGGLGGYDLYLTILKEIEVKNEHARDEL